jgi:hypothetical protein
VTSTNRLSRRRFVATALGVGGSVAVARIRPWSLLAQFAPPSPAMRLVGLFAHPKSARAVGEAYLASAPMDSAAPRLMDQLTTGLSGGRSTIDEANDAELRELLVTRIGADFEKGRVVDVDGWILATTEARLYALAALL